MKVIGLHAPPQGATQEFHDVAASLAAGAITYLWDCNPGDTRPGQINIVRLPTPLVAERPADYADRVHGTIEEWYFSSVNPIFVPGNEPDIEGPWRMTDWESFLPLYMAKLRSIWPSITLAVPAYSVARMSWMTTETASLGAYVCAHCYWPVERADSIDDPEWGGAWRFAHDTGVRTLITEVNSNPTNPEQIARWFRTLPEDVVCATLFGADLSSSEWPFYDVTTDEARAIAAALTTPPAPPQPPQPPPPVAIGQYVRDVNVRTGVPFNRDAWINFIAASNPAEARLIVGIYERDAPVAIPGYDINLAVAQGCVETTNFTSQRWRAAKNAAGIGIYSDDTPDVQFGTAENGIRAQLELLSDYYGSGFEPWGILRAYKFGGMTLNKTRLSEMDGVWAEDRGYSLAIVQRANLAMGGFSFGVTGDMVAQKALAYLGATTFVDEGVLVEAYYHCEEFDELAHEDAGIPRRRYPDALSHAYALPLERRRGRTGEVGFWQGPGWSVYGHTGIFLPDGGVISALSKVTITYGWESDPGYMGCAYYPGVGMDGGDEMLPSDGTIDWGELESLWTSLGAVWNPGSGIFTDWLAKRHMGIDYGVPIGHERGFENNSRVILLFTSGFVAQWTQGDDTVRWLGTMPNLPS